MRLDATQVLDMSNQYTKELAEANIQMQLLNYLSEYITDPANKYQLIPSNVGLTEPVSASLINTYNQSVLSRNRAASARFDCEWLYLFLYFCRILIYNIEGKGGSDEDTVFELFEL